MAKGMGEVVIEGMNFTLFYDYDQLVKPRLTKLSDSGKKEWFRFRMEMVFLEPLRRIFNQDSLAHKEPNSSPGSKWPRSAVMLATFSILLNGVEALGSFLPFSKAYVNEYNKHRTKSYFAFREFIQRYMKDWDVQIQNTSYKSSYLPEILWDHFRNGIAHAFVIGGGGIAYQADPTRWRIERSCYLEIGPVTFFEDFLKGVTRFFRDVETKHRTEFLSRFKEAYPH